MRFTNILMAYFVIGVVMWGGGAIVWDDAGVGQFFINDPTGDTADQVVNAETGTKLNNLGGPITQVVGQTIGGGLIATWNLLVGVIGFVFWPTTVLLSVNAPPSVVLLGTSLTVAFFGAIMRLVRGSA